MKAKTQRKMQRAIVNQKAIKRSELARISQAQQVVHDKYDWTKKFRKANFMGGIWGY